MIKIEKHIRDLLHDNDCVIVPKMGGFLNSNSLPGIHSFKLSSGTISKNISFNVLLKYNDGLLANHMVKNEKLSYDEALLEIDKFVDEFHHVTDSGGKFKIDQVGILYKDAEQNIQIEPFMYLNNSDDSQVNSDVKPYPEIKETNQEKVIHPDSVFISQPIKIHPKKSRAFKKSKFIFFIFLTAVGVLSFGIYFYFSSPSQSDSDSLILNDLNLSDQSKISDANRSKSEPGAQPANSDVPTGKNKQTTQPVAEKANMKSGIFSGSNNVSADISENKNYFIIAGSFKSIENAERKLDELKLHGFVNAQIFSDSRKFQLVSYDRFSTYDEANEKIKSIRIHYKEAWIYHQ